MSTYIKRSTLEYPRHIGDIDLDANGMSDYALVPWVNPPVYNPLTQRCYEIAPIEVDNTWVMQWQVRDATVEEIEEAKAASKYPLGR